MEYFYFAYQILFFIKLIVGWSIEYVVILTCAGNGIFLFCLPNTFFIKLIGQNQEKKNYDRLTGILTNTYTKYVMEKGVCMTGSRI